MSTPRTSSEVEALNERLAREHPIDDYYAKSPLLIRRIEQKRLAIIRRMIGPCQGLELAEVGSGGGHVLEMFPEAKLTAIDVAQSYLDTAAKNLEGYDVRFIKGEVDKLDLPSSSFDRVICTEVLEHTADPEAILSAIFRLLRKNGVAVITVPNDPLILGAKRLLRYTPVGWALRKKIEWGGDEFHLHQWRPAEFRAMLERHGRVTQYDASPHRAVPIRACFRCVQH